MSDAFRSRSSTWSDGRTLRNFPDTDSPPTGLNTFEYRVAYPKTANHESLSIHAPEQRFRYSPTSSTHTNELSSQDFHSRCLYNTKTPDLDYGGSYPSFFNANDASTSSPRRGSKDWSHNLTAMLPSASSSNFSVMSTPTSSFGHPEIAILSGPSQPYSTSSPYSPNGSCCPDSTAKQLLHSGSPSSVGSGHKSSIQISASASKSAKRPARRNPWGPETYSDLIAKAIESYPEKQATLQQIYDFISSNHAYFRERSDPPASAGWKNSIRHNLSLHDKFVKCPKASESAKSSHWRLNSNSLNRPYIRRRACSMETGNGKKAKTRPNAIAYNIAAKRGVATQIRKCPQGSGGLGGSEGKQKPSFDEIVGLSGGDGGGFGCSSGMPPRISIASNSAFSVPANKSPEPLSVPVKKEPNVNWALFNSPELKDDLHFRTKMRPQDHSYELPVKGEERFQSPKNSCLQRITKFTATNLSSKPPFYMEPSSSSLANGSSSSRYPLAQSRFNESFTDFQPSRYSTGNNNGNNNFTGHGTENTSSGQNYSRINEIPMDNSSYSLSGLLSNSLTHHQSTEGLEGIPERFLRTCAAEETIQPVISNSHLHHLLTGDTASYMRSTYQAAAAAAGFDEATSGTSVNSSLNNSTSVPSAAFQHPNESYLEALELEISLQVANRVIGNCVSLSGGSD